MDFWKPSTAKPSTGKPPAAAPKKESGSQQSHVKPTLSKGVMGMKFMKQKETESAKKAETAQKLKESEVASSANSSETTYDLEHFDFAAQLPGRRSFNGCNKAVERFYESRMEELKYKKKISVEPSNTISDEEMLKRYENLIGLPRGPNQGQRPAAKSAPTNKAPTKSHNKVYKRDRSMDEEQPTKKSKKQQ